MIFRRSLAVLLLCLCSPTAGIAQTRKASDPIAVPAGTPPDPFKSLKFRYIGPPGNRVPAVIGEPGNPNVYYAGAASGGVWKSEDGGDNWYPVFDEQTAQSIGSIAIAPSNHSVLWVGTGETFIRSNVSLGNGIYRSGDAGKTWQHMGLEKSGRIGRIVIDPHDPNIVYAAVLGHAYAPQQERGIYRTKDGGKSWQQVLFVDENTGASDLTMDPKDPRKLIAGTWQIDIKTWGRKSGGPGSGIWMTTDGGDTWQRVEKHGLPETPLGKIAVAFAPSDSNRVYALIETGQGGTLWRSDSGGYTWRLMNSSRLLNERPHYYTRMLVMPDNADEVYFPGNFTSVTTNGGSVTEQEKCPGFSLPNKEEAGGNGGEYGCGGDNHDMWADPTNPNRMMVGGDGGVMISTTRGRSWKEIALPIAQMYHVATDNKIPYNLYGHRQDGPTMRGPSQVPGDSIINASQWTTTAGCETGWNIPDPVDDNIIWGGCYAGVTERLDLRSGHARSVSVWRERTMGANAGEVKIRMNWTYPIAISPHDHNTVYVGSQYVHKTSDGGQTWQQISPDLTLNDPTMHGDSGGLTVDNLSVEYAGVVFAMAESPLEKGQIWAGTNDGQLQVTRDGGKNWSNVTSHIPNLPAKMTVESVEPSKYAAGTCYVAFDGHQVGIFDPYLYKTTDFGKTWTRIITGITSSPLSYTHVVREDPVRKGLLYAGTENGLYVSFNDGANWSGFQQTLPHTPVYWLTVQPRFNDLVIGTYGRGFWILDDISPLQDWHQNKETVIFPARAAYRFRSRIQRQMAPLGASVGENPPYGGDINYVLPAEIPAEKLKERMSMQVLDGEGKVVRKLHPTGNAGINRVWWNLHYEPMESIAMRTTPPGNPHIWEEKRFAGKDTRPVFYYGIGGENTDGSLVVPGEYTIKLTVDGKDYTQKMPVLRDPNTLASDDDIVQSSVLAYKIYRDADESVALINRIEVVRRQLDDTKKLLTANKAEKPLLDATAKLDQQFLEQENKLMHPTIAEGDIKSFRGPIGLYLKFIWLGAEVGTGTGEIAGNADFAPTRSEVEVFDMLHQQLGQVQATLDGLTKTAVPAYNEVLQRAGMMRVIPATVSQTEK